MTPLERLQEWYLGECNEEWEHQYGVKIDTLDNPGWIVTIDLYETSIEKKAFADMERQRSEHDWVVARLKDHKFEVLCGPRNLGEALTVFCDWAEAS